MKVRLLKALNIPGIIVIALIAMALQGTLFNNSSLAFFQPDIILFLVLWLAMKRDFEEGGILTLVLGYLVELKFIFLIARFLYKNFQVLNRRSLILVGIGASLFSRLDILFILYLLNKADNEWFHTLQLLAPTMIVHAALIPFVFKFLYRFDFWTLKNPEAEHRYERDFYLDEEPV